MTSYLTSTDLFPLSRTVFETFDFILFKVWPWPWPLISQGHLRSKIFLTIRTLVHDFLSNFPWLFFSISYCFWDIWFQTLGFDFDLWPLKVIKGQKILYHLKAHTWLLFWHPLTLILYLVPFLRYLTSNFFRVWPWPLTSKGHMRSKFFIPFESPYMTSYLTSIDTFFLWYRFWDIWLETF